MNCAVLQKLLCEFVGTFGLTFTVVMTQTGTYTPFAASAFLACFAYAFGSISGTHINPAVSIGVFTWGLIDGTAKAIELPLYVLSQFVGAVLGGVLGAVFLKAKGGTVGAIGAFPFRPSGNLG